MKTVESISETGKRAAVSPFSADNQRKQAQRKNHKAEPERTPFDGRKYLFDQLEQMQRAFPKSAFAKTPIDRTKNQDKALVKLIIEALGSSDENTLLDYCSWVSFQFKGMRAPGDPAGPKTMGLLIEWAKDYRRIGRGAGAQ